MADAPYDPTPSPPPTLQPGQGVRWAAATGAYDGADFQAAGRIAVITGYATPEIKRHQRCTAESYYFRWENEAAGTRRWADRNRFADPQ